MIETSERQAPQTVEAFARYGLAPEVVACEEMDATVVVGSAGASAHHL